MSTSNWSEGVRDLLERDLHCPACHEQNAALHRAITVNDHGLCYCSVCSRSGPLIEFQVKEPE